MILLTKNKIKTNNSREFIGVTLVVNFVVTSKVKNIFSLLT